MMKSICKKCKVVTSRKYLSTEKMLSNGEMFVLNKWKCMECNNEFTVEVKDLDGSLVPA